MGWIITLPVIGVIIYIVFVVRYLKSGKREIDNIEKTQKEEHSSVNKSSPQNRQVIKEFYVKVYIGSAKPKWEENITGNLPQEKYKPIFESILDILFNYTDSKDDDIDVSNLERRVIIILFTVDLSDERMIIKGLESFQTDLSNNEYSTTECVELIRVFTHLLRL